MMPTGTVCAIMLDMHEGAWLNVLHIKLSVKSNFLRAVVITVEYVILHKVILHKSYTAWNFIKSN